MGHLPRVFDNPVAALALQYRPFGVGQALMAKNQIGNPILEGLRVWRETGDRSLLDLGLRRGARLGAYGAPASAAASTGYSLLSGRAPTAASLTRDILGGTLGTAGDVAYELGSAIAAPGEDSPVERLFNIPAVAAVSRPVDKAFQGLGDLYQGDLDAALLTFGQAGLAAAPAFDRTGITGMTAKPVGNLLDVLRKEAEDNARRSSGGFGGF
jgi:hypothetical protein